MLKIGYNLEYKLLPNYNNKKNIKECFIIFIRL